MQNQKSQHPVMPFGYVPPPAAHAAWGNSGALPAPVFASGNMLDIPVSHAALPHLCAKCGGGEGLRGRMEILSRTPPLAIFALLLGVVPGLLLILALTKKAKVVVPLCSACDRRWTSSSRFWGLSIFLPFPMLVLGWWLCGLGVFETGSGVALAFLPFLVSVIVGPTLTRFLVVRPRTLWVTRIDAHRARVAGAGPAMLAGVPRGA